MEILWLFVKHTFEYLYEYMTWVYRVVIIALGVILYGCGGVASRRTVPAATAMSVVKIDTPQSFVKNYGLSDNDSLFVFVGQKIAVTPLPEKYLSMDYCFKARYLILQRVFGNFKEDTIEFVVFDHHGMPAFSLFENVLLYVSETRGTYYHEKYLFNDVYRTKDGKWAGPYAIQDYGHEYNMTTKVKPVKIDFLEEVNYLTVVVRDSEKIALSYPAPYYKTVGDKAIAVYGNYVQELYELKRDGCLRARREWDNH